MKTLLKPLFCITMLLFGSLSMIASNNVHILLITGGHDFDKEQFTQMMDQLPEITYDWVEHPEAHAMLKADKIKKYDAVLLYDMPKEIAEEAQKDFIAMLEAGKGLVVLHHAFCSYDFWPEYTKIVGGRYHHYPWKKDGIEQPLSVYQHDVSFRVRVKDPSHPITQGINDFDITDETYGRTEILSTVHALLGTEEPGSGPLVGWTNTYKNANIFTFLLGHDHQAWQNPAFSKILSQGIYWTVKTEARNK